MPLSPRISTFTGLGATLCVIVDDVACRLTGSDDELAFVAFGDFLAQPDDVAPKILALAGVDEQRAQRVEVDVLGRVVVRAQPHRLDGDRRTP